MLFYHSHELLPASHEGDLGTEWLVSILGEYLKRLLLDSFTGGLSYPLIPGYFKAGCLTRLLIGCWR